MTVKIKFQRTREGAEFPTYANYDDCGLDLRACLGGTLFWVAPGETVKIPLGFATEIPLGWAVLVLPRSGLAAKKNITLQNSPGLIDAGYRGEWCILLRNEGIEPFLVRDGDRIAQAVIIKNHNVVFQEVEGLVSSNRGEGGFGSTGIK